MDYRERIQDIDETLRGALDGRQGKLQTAMPGVVQSFDPVAMTCVVAPAIKGRLTDQAGNATFVEMPLLLDCPCQFPSGGGVTLTFPVAAGDECLVVFSSRSIDSWHQSGGIQAPAGTRMHDLSDGFVILGVRSKPRMLSDISTTAAQLRSDDGATVLELDPQAQTIKLTAPGGITLDGPVAATSTIAATGEVTGNGTALHTHTHRGVSTGTGHTGQPD